MRAHEGRNRTKAREARRGGPYLANRCLALISVIYSQAERWGVVPRGTNPVLGIEKFPERGRERRLSDQELAALGSAIREAEKSNQISPVILDALRLLIYTGCRKNEILCLKWAEVAVAAACLRLADSKTGPRSVPLNLKALEILERQPVQLDENGVKNPFVFPAQRKVKSEVAGHLVGLPKAWERIREKAGLPDLRLHDLRHNFVSIGYDQNENERIVGLLAGHREVQTTRKYGHLKSDPLRAATERIAAAVERGWRGRGGKSSGSKKGGGRRRCRAKPPFERGLGERMPQGAQSAA